MTKELSRELLDILACPVCKQGLSFDKAKNELKCLKCKKEYKVVDGIPILMS